MAAWTDVQEVTATSSWETFCREEARQWASAFLERVRGFKLRNSVAREVHDSTFTNEFSAAFLEESSILLSNSNGMLPQSNGRPAQIVTSLPAAYSHDAGLSRPPVPGPEVASPRKTSKAKSWLSNFFKWPRSTRSRSSGTNTSSNLSRQGRSSRRNTVMVKEEQVRMLNMNADNSTSSYAWQPCKLALVQEHTTHQLEVYCPPKNPVPKMSLFCFLIREVRPATSLEIPDISTCFVIKSANHGEYVFDAGSEDKKQSWISTIKTYSSNLAPTTNGHLPRYSTPSGSNRQRSYSIGAADLRPSMSSSLPRPLPTPPIVTGSSTAQGTQDRSTNPQATLDVPPSGIEATSEESVLMDVSSFLRNHPNRSPSRRRNVQSMYVESTVNMDPPPAASLSQGAQFPYGSPGASPPPVPKRGLRPKNVSVGSSSRLDQAVPKSKSPSPQLISAHNDRDTPQRRLSQPHNGLRATSELPSNLDTCSASSSSSALHPVSLADLERRGPISPCHARNSSQLSVVSEGHGPAAIATTASSRVRKISAPVTVPDHSYLNRDVVHPEHHNESPAFGKNHSPENFLPYPPGNHDNDQLEHRMPNNDDTSRPGEAGDNREGNEDMSTKATFNFPYSSHSPQSRPLFDETQHETRRRVVPYTRLNVSSLVDHISRSSSRENETIVERSHSRASNNTDGSEERESGNPLYIETTESESHSQPTMHTHHPYENWATTSQDVENLRLLSQYPWFHGMISRNNASQLVLGEGESGTGQYLVRQSESREGDFVLTFNYHNRAKHLRMTVDETGCNIQHLWFDDVPGMLDYFKANSIPLESFWLNNDVKLTSHIDRKKSDSIRTTTVVNMTRLNRVPPRRSRSLHLSISQAVASSTETPSPPDRSISSSTSSNSQSTNSLPQSARNSVGLRQLFRSQRSSSAGNMTVHGVRGGGDASVQRRHSTNAGSMMDTRGHGSGRGRGPAKNGQNTYVYRNY